MKIHNGLLIKRKITLSELSTLTQELRPKLDEMVEQAQTLAITRCAVSAHDRAVLGIYARSETDQILDQNPYARGRLWLEDMRERDARGEHQSVPMDFDAVFYGVSSRKTLVAPFGNRLLCEAFIKAFGAQAYEYWDHSDPDENCSAVEWSRRRHDWEKALNGSDSFKDSGITAQMVSGKYRQWWFPEPASIDKILDISDEFSPQTRGLNLAKEILRSSFMKGTIKEGVDEIPDTSGLMDALMLWDLAKQTHEKEINDIGSLLGAGLPKLCTDTLRLPFDAITKMGEPLSAALKDKIALEGPGVLKETAARTPGFKRRI